MSIEIECYVERYQDSQWCLLTDRMPELREKGLWGFAEFDFGITGGIGGNCRELFAVLGYPFPDRPNMPNPIVPLRGFPNDCSPQLKEIAQDAFKRLPGWALLSELKTCKSKQKTEMPTWLVELLDKSTAKLSSVGSEDAIRIVYWFDN